jgi:hypothetical protein
MKKALAMEHLRCAFRRGDLQTATRVYITHRISWQTYRQTQREVAEEKGRAANLLPPAPESR